MNTSKMTIETAREIMHLSLRSAAARNVDLGALLRERATLIARGDVVLAGEVSRTIDSLAGHWRDGALVDAEAIAEATRLTRGAASEERNDAQAQMMRGEKPEWMHGR